jgi:four helix bundle protein
MSDIKTYKDLIVWQKSVELVKLLYQLTRELPSDEKFGLVNQLRRASVSIPSNIAEGFGRKTQKERIQFFVIAYGSALEIETQLHISKELGFGTSKAVEKAESILLEVLKMLNKMTSSVRISN